MNEILDRLKFLKGLYMAKTSFSGNDGLTLFVKKNKEDKHFFAKITFQGLIGFHDTGLIEKPISYTDCGLLGFKYRSYVQASGQNPDDFNQIVFMTENNGSKRELIVACRNILITLE